MDEEDDLERAAARLVAAVEALEAALGREGGSAEHLRTLTDQLHYLQEERSRLTAELEAERERGQRLLAANDEVSERLDTLSRTLKPGVVAEG